VATKSRQNDGLAVDRPEAFLKREHAAQKAGIVVLVLFVLAGMAGLFGDGPLSDSVVHNGAVTVTFERFTRQTTGTGLQVVADTPTTDGAVAIRLRREFLDDIDILEVRPANALKRLEADVVVFEVPAARGQAFLQLRYEPKRYGVLRTDIFVGAQPAAHVRQLVFF